MGVGSDDPFQDGPLGRSWEAIPVGTGIRLGVERFAEFCDRHLRHADDCMREYVQSAEFDRLLVATVQRAFPPHEHEQLVAHYHGLLVPGPTTSARPQAKRD